MQPGMKSVQPFPPPFPHTPLPYYASQRAKRPGPKSYVFWCFQKQNYLGCVCVLLCAFAPVNGEWRHTISAKKKIKLGNLNHKCRASQTKDKNTHTSAQTPGVSINTLEGWHFHGWTPE